MACSLNIESLSYHALLRLVSVTSRTELPSSFITRQRALAKLHHTTLQPVVLTTIFYRLMEKGEANPGLSKIHILTPLSGHRMYTWDGEHSSGAAVVLQRGVCPGKELL